MPNERDKNKPQGEHASPIQTAEREGAPASSPEARFDNQAEDRQADPQDEREHQEEGGTGLEHEVDILRGELMTLQRQVDEARKESAEFKDKFLRARADLENYRRRAAQDADRAREAGVDSAVLAVLPAYDDLGRALQAAETDPAKIIPGVEAVREGLKRNLEALGIKEVGKQGDAFDPDFHEALSSLATDDKALAGKVAEVYQVGFTKEGRLVRPARVVVYQA